MGLNYDKYPFLKDNPMIRGHSYIGFHNETQLSWKLYDEWKKNDGNPPWQDKEYWYWLLNIELKMISQLWEYDLKQSRRMKNESS